MNFAAFYVIVFGVFTLCNAKCNFIYEHGVSDEEQQQIVDLHNSIRKDIMNGKIPGQARGKNLKVIKYDKHLADEAQKVSDTCTVAHVKIYDDRWQVGQNLYTSMSTRFQKGANWTKAINSWLREYKFYTYGGEINKKNGHYTQLIWGDTEYIGCGYTLFDTDSYFKYQKLYTCNYGPPGNYKDRAPYERASEKVFNWKD